MPEGGKGRLGGWLEGCPQVGIEIRGVCDPFERFFGGKLFESTRRYG